jgi:hypothetical protein
MPLGANWKVKDGTVYKFKNREAPGGPSEIKVVVLKGGASLKIAGRSVGSELNDPPTREISVVFTIGAGSDRYCGGCVLAQKDTTDAFVAKQCPAPSACGASSPSGAFLYADAATKLTSAPWRWCGRLLLRRDVSGPGAAPWPWRG